MKGMNISEDGTQPKHREKEKRVNRVYGPNQTDLYTPARDMEWAK